MTFEKLKTCSECGNYIDDSQETALTSLMQELFGMSTCDSCVREYYPDVVAEYEEEV